MSNHASLRQPFELSDNVGMWQRFSKVFGLGNVSASSTQENYPEPSEFAHPGNRSLFHYFSQNSHYVVDTQQYETCTHPDLAEILFDLAPDAVARKGYAYGRPVIANKQGLIFAWAGGNRDFFTRLNADKVEAACQEGARHDPTYPPEWVSFYMFGLGPDWKQILQRWVITSYEETLALA
jgi:hypothetical protein